MCAIINSGLIREFVKTYSSAGRGFGTPSVMNHIAIPKFAPKNKLHHKLTHLSKSLHEYKHQRELDKIEMLEKEVDGRIRELFGIRV